VPRPQFLAAALQEERAGSNISTLIEAAVIIGCVVLGLFFVILCFALIAYESGTHQQRDLDQKVDTPSSIFIVLVHVLHISLLVITFLSVGFGFWYLAIKIALDAG